jgi:hypothetical protein
MHLASGSQLEGTWLSYKYQEEYHFQNYLATFDRADIFRIHCLLVRLVRPHFIAISFIADGIVVVAVAVCAIVSTDRDGEMGALSSVPSRAGRRRCRRRTAPTLAMLGTPVATTVDEEEYGNGSSNDIDGMVPLLHHFRAALLAKMF